MRNFPRRAGTSTRNVLPEGILVGWGKGPSLAHNTKKTQKALPGPCSPWQPPGLLEKACGLAFQSHVPNTKAVRGNVSAQALLHRGYTVCCKHPTHSLQLFQCRLLNKPGFPTS